MDSSVEQFLEEERLFAGRPKALALYRQLRDALLGSFPAATVDVQKTQVTFRDPRGFAILWHPSGYRDGRVVLSFALDRPMECPRLKTRPVPVRRGLWMHHLWLEDVQALDGEVAGWLREAHALRGGKP